MHGTTSEPSGNQQEDGSTTYTGLTLCWSRSPWRTSARRSWSTAARHEIALEAEALPEFLNTHNLPRLLNEIGLQVDKWFLGVLERLTRAAVWAGRYPVPSSVKHLGRSRRLGIMIEVYTADDLDDLRRLVAAVEKVAADVLGPG
jgi:hypothetical protein